MAALTASVYAFAPPFFSDTIVPVRADLLEDRRRVVRDRVLGRLRDAVPLVGQDVQQDRALLRP